LGFKFWETAHFRRSSMAVKPCSLPSSSVGTSSAPKKVPVVFSPYSRTSNLPTMFAAPQGGTRQPLAVGLAWYEVLPRTARSRSSHNAPSPHDETRQVAPLELRLPPHFVKTLTNIHVSLQSEKFA
jgi:hypothetical protein